jgi:O-antigen/teichoic acid export membrane protein
LTEASPTPPDFKVSASFMAAAMMLYSLGQFAISFFLGRIGGSEAIGAFSLANACALPTLALLQLSQRPMYIAEPDSAVEFGIYLDLRVIGSALAVVVALGLASVQAGSVAALLAAAPIIVARAVESVTDILYAPPQKSHDIAAVARSTAVRGILNAAATIATFVVTHSFLLAACAFCLSCCLCLALLDVPAAYRSMGGKLPRPQPRRTAYWGLARRSTPLLAATALISIAGVFPRYLLNHLDGLRAVGHFAILELLVAPGYLLMNALGQAAAPRLSAAARPSLSPRFWRLLLTFGGGALVLGVAGVGLSLAIGRTLVISLFGAEFADAGAVLPLMALSAAMSFVVSVCGYGVVACRRYEGFAWRFAASAAATGLVAWLAVPTFGLAGGVFGLMAGHVVSLVSLGSILAGEHSASKAQAAQTTASGTSDAAG